jgi:general stress protein CsbA
VLQLPSSEALVDMRRNKRVIQWVAISRLDGREHLFSSRRDLLAAARKKVVVGGDVCQTYAYAPPQTLWEACDAHSSLRVLTAPQRAYAEKAGNLAALSLASLGIVSALAYGLVLAGTEYINSGIIALVFAVIAFTLFARVSRNAAFGLSLAGVVVVAVMDSIKKGSGEDIWDSVCLVLFIGPIFVVALAIVLGFTGYGIGYVIGRTIGTMLARSGTSLLQRH